MESGIQNKLVAELFLPIPEPSHISGRVELESFEFSSDQQVFYRHEGVGSGEYTSVNTKQKKQKKKTCFEIFRLNRLAFISRKNAPYRGHATLGRSRDQRTAFWMFHCSSPFPLPC